MARYKIYRFYGLLYIHIISILPFLLVGGIPGKWPPRAVSSSPTKLLQMSIINKLKADARYDNFHHGGGINVYLFVNVKRIIMSRTDLSNELPFYVSEGINQKYKIQILRNLVFLNAPNLSLIRMMRPKKSRRV